MVAGFCFACLPRAVSLLTPVQKKHGFKTALQSHGELPFLETTEMRFFYLMSPISLSLALPIKCFQLLWVPLRWAPWDCPSSYSHRLRDFGAAVGPPTSSGCSSSGTFQGWEVTLLATWSLQPPARNSTDSFFPALLKDHSRWTQISLQTCPHCSPRITGLSCPRLGDQHDCTAPSQCLSSLAISHQETRVLSRGHHQNPWSCSFRAHVDTRMRTYLSTAFCKHHSACLGCCPMKANPIMACLAAFHHLPQNRRAGRNSTGGSANSGRSTGASPRQCQKGPRYVVTWETLWAQNHMPTPTPGLPSRRCSALL